MTNKKEEENVIRSNLYESKVLWFYAYTEKEKELMEDDESDEVQVAIIPYLDYEIIAPNQWHVHIDIETDYPGFARIRVRTSYEVNCIFEHLFTHEGLDILYEKAVELCIAGLNDRCICCSKSFHLIKMVRLRCRRDW